MGRIVLYDTSVASENIGDFIIMESVNSELAKSGLTHQVTTAPTHDRVGRATWRNLWRSHAAIVGGSNLLSSDLLTYRQWKLSLIDLVFLRGKVVLVGVGWWQYQDRVRFLTKLVYRFILKKDAFHSVRDEYTKNMLISIGVKNVINTSCATMWSLKTKLTWTKADNVVFTLTDYNPDHVKDKLLIETLIGLYESVYFWPQGTGDLEYFESLAINEDVIICKPRLDSFNTILDKGNIHYVGTRLHAGIRALQKEVYSVIISIDNRAREKSKDFNIPVVERKKVEDLIVFMQKKKDINLLIPKDEIKEWRLKNANIL